MKESLWPCTQLRFALLLRCCRFWADNDGWIGTADELGVAIRGSSFEDAKWQMEAAAPQSGWDQSY